MYPYHTNRASKVHYLHPSLRFPPLREWNRERRAFSVPPACRGFLPISLRRLRVRGLIPIAEQEFKKQQLMTPSLRSDKGTSLEFAACGGVRIFVALTPSPSPTLWARGVGAHGGAPFLALTPSPSPTAWERGAARSPSPAGGSLKG